MLYQDQEEEVGPEGSASGEAVGAEWQIGSDNP